MRKIMGLTDSEAEESAKKYGKNALTPKKQKTFLQIYFGNYEDPMITVLLIALAMNVIFTFLGKVDWNECCGILLSVIISTFVSALSEYSNENTFRRISEDAENAKCKVYRNDKLCEIRVSEVVKGDLILLQGGDIVPADGRIEYGSISVDQSALNGESKEAEKKFGGRLTEKMSFNDFWSESNLFRGSVVCSGEARMIADVIGDNTVYGKLTAEAQEKNRESPMTVKLSKLAKSISKFGGVSAVLIVIISFVNTAFASRYFDPVMIAGYFSDTAQVISDVVGSLIIGITVIVVAVPEGLPLMIAIVCSLNMKKMLKANVLVRRLIGIETSGEINILFTDKTGTITTGRPKVVRFYDGCGSEFLSFSHMNEGLSRLVAIGAVNSSAKFSSDSIIGGNATDKALLEFVGKKNISLGTSKVIKVIPFSSEKKFSAVTVDTGRKVTLVKGAPEFIISRCDSCYKQDGTKCGFDRKLTDKILNASARRSMRSIAIGVFDGEIGDKLPDKMIFVGIAEIRDDVRPEAKTAVSEVKRAGVQVVMITGDRAETAKAIAKEAGIMCRGDIILTSAELGDMTDDEVMRIMPDLRVVARALPSDKSRLVRLAQEMNYVVGMTGDGVNDAPALKLADVGFAMGGGTEAASAAADIVILDDNFRSVRNAILYGRTIYNSIKKFIKFQLTINFAAVAVSMLGPIIGVEKPLDISQMIWTNLIIDSLAAIAFGGEPALERFMREKPRRRDEDIIDKKMWIAIASGGLFICGVSLMFFTAPFIKGIFRQGVEDIYFYTGYFNLFIFISIFNGFNTRCDGIDLFENIAANKQFLTVMALIAVVQILMTYYGGRFLRTSALNLKEWTAVMALAITIFPADIIRKLIMNRFGWQV